MCLSWIGKYFINVLQYFFKQTTCVIESRKVESIHLWFSIDLDVEIVSFGLFPYLDDSGCRV